MVSAKKKNQESAKRTEFIWGLKICNWGDSDLVTLKMCSKEEKESGPYKDKKPWSC